MKDYFLNLAHYNKWANGKLFDVVSTLTSEEFESDCDVYFKSVKGTLNHLLVGDILWLSRLKGKPVSGLKLNDILYENLVDLTRARQELDADIIQVLSDVDDAFVESDLNYQSTAGHEYTAPMQVVLGHMFNHQTHHRSHVHACLSRLGKDAPDLDIIYFHLGM